MEPHDLLDTAQHLATSRRGRPRQTDLRRAISTVYYALFHCLAGCVADLLVGSARSRRREEVWLRAYCALEHGHAKNQCLNRGIIEKFPEEIQDFASVFLDTQTKRHSADYDPSPRFQKFPVLRDIAIAGKTIGRFNSVATKDRRAFAVHVVMKTRRN